MLSISNLINNNPSIINDYKNVMSKYLKNARIYTFVTHYKIMDGYANITIPAHKSQIGNIDLNKFLKNIIILSSNLSCDIGNQGEFMKYKKMKDAIEITIKTLKENNNTEQLKIKELMLEETIKKCEFYNTINEFSKNKKLHNQSKNILKLLSEDTMESSNFFKLILNDYEGKQLYIPLLHRKNKDEHIPI